MAIIKIEHLGIAVSDIQQANKLFSALLNQTPYKHESVQSEHVSTSFFQLGESKIELLESTSTDSAISKFIEKRGEGIHHIALDVQDIEYEIKRLKNLGFQFINETPKQGADNKLIVFLHPKSTGGVLVELCEENLT
jgi:methylmalonyl-CoA/ethylmalonyl-CoA epimerase